MEILIFVTFMFTISNGLDTNETVKIDIDVNKTNFNDIGSKIVATVLEPSGTWEELQTSVDCYFRGLEKLHSDMLQECQYTFDVFDKIKSAVGPQQCREHLNGSQMIAYFNMTSNTVSQFYRIVEATKLTWDRTEDLAKELREKYRKRNEVTTPDGLGISQIEWQMREAKMDLREAKRKKAQEEKERRQARREERTLIREEIAYAKETTKERKLQIRRMKEIERLHRQARRSRKKG